MILCIIHYLSNLINHSKCIIELLGLDLKRDVFVDTTQTLVDQTRGPMLMMDCGVIVNCP